MRQVPYKKDTSIMQEPEFSSSKHYREAHGLLFGQMICNYTICYWPTISSSIWIVDQNSVEGSLIVIDCIGLGANYWCPYGSNGLYNVYTVFAQMQSNLLKVDPCM